MQLPIPAPTYYARKDWIRVLSHLRHWRSDFTLSMVLKYREEQRDALYSLSQIVLPLRDSAGASIAATFADYMGPTMLGRTSLGNVTSGLSLPIEVNV